MSRPVDGGYRQQPRRLCLAHLLAADGPVTPRVGQILRLPAPFQAFDPKFVSAGIALPIVRSKVDQDPDAPLITTNVGESDVQ